MSFKAKDVYAHIPDDIDYAVVILVNMPVLGEPTLVSFNNDRFERGYTSVVFYEKNKAPTCVRFRSEKSNILSSVTSSKNRFAIIADASDDYHNVASVFPLDFEQFERARYRMNTCDLHYDTAFSNCTTFAISVLNSAGIKIDLQPKKWIITEQNAVDFKRVFKLPFFTPKQIYRFFSWVIRNKKGYSPADLGMYLISGDCEATYISLSLC